LFAHTTCVTPTLSEAVPASVTDVLLVVYVAPAGWVIVTVGGVASGTIPVPVTARETVSPSAAKLTLVVEVATDVGVNRTVTWVDPEPGSVNGLPETTRNAPDADAVPETLPDRVFWIVNTRSTVLPTITFPKLTLPLGVTERESEAVPLTVPEQAL
jgi:hypothetical protein